MPASSNRAPTDRKLIASNRKAYHEYTIVDTVEAGLALFGTEVKSLRAGRASLVDDSVTSATVSLDLHGLHIPEYAQGTWTNHEPRRTRKLLLHKRSEIDRLISEGARGRADPGAVAMYFSDGWAKVELGLARGKRSTTSGRTWPSGTPSGRSPRALGRRARAASDPVRAYPSVVRPGGPGEDAAMTTADPGSRAGSRDGSPAGDHAALPVDGPEDEPVRLQRLVEAGPAVAYARAADPPHRVTFVSGNVQRIIGLTVEELTTASTPFGGLLHPDDRRTVADHWDRLLREGAAVSEYRLGRAGGRVCWIRDEQSVVRDADGRPLEIVGSLLDVTEQKRTEERAERLQGSPLVSPPRSPPSRSP